MRLRIVTIIIGLVLFSHGAFAGSERPETHSMEATMQVRGDFDVRTIPQAPDDPSAGPFGRLLLDKTFHGELEASSQGQMMAFQCAQEGSASYVALEQVTGTLGGKSGSFVLQHDAMMQGGETSRWNVLVVPHSGTGELAGITGEMKIIIEGGKHHYEFTYSLEP